MAHDKLTTKIKRFCTTGNNLPVVALELVQQVVEQVVEHQNSTPLAFLVKRAPKGLPIRAVIGKAMTGIKIDTTSKKAKAHVTGTIVTLDNPQYSNKYSHLQELVKAKESIKGKAVREEYLDKQAPEFDFDKLIKSVVAKLEKESVNKALFIQALKAA